MFQNAHMGIDPGSILRYRFFFLTVNVSVHLISSYIRDTGLSIGIDYVFEREKLALLPAGFSILIV